MFGPHAKVSLHEMHFYWGSLVNFVNVPGLIAYLGLTVLLPYAFFRWLVVNYNFEHNKKKDHIADVTQACSFGLCAYFLGRYNVSFRWVLLLGYYLGLAGFIAATKIDCFRISLNTWRVWNRKSWLVMLLAVFSTTCAFVRLVHEPDFVESLPFFSLKLSLILTYFFRNIWHYMQGSYRFHLHHWQIFYAIALLTHFNTDFSRFFGGLALGIYMQGVICYGFDPMIKAQRP